MRIFGLQEGFKHPVDMYLCPFLRYHMVNMNLSQRRGLALLFLLVFFLVAPLTLAYTDGYRLSFSPLKITRTGTIYISGNPKTVNIFLNGEKQKPQNLPLNIRNIIPGEYQLKITEKNYQDWEKNIQVNVGESTVISNVQLIKQDPFTTVQTGLGKDAVFSPNGSLLAWHTEKKIFIADGKKLVTSQDIENLSRIVWGNDSLVVIALDNKNQTLARLTLDTKIETIKSIGKDLRFISANSKIILAQNEDDLYLFQNNNWQADQKKDFLDTELSSNYFLTLQKNNPSKFTLDWHKFDGNLITKKNLPNLTNPGLFSENGAIWVSDILKKTSLWVEENLLDYKLKQIQIAFTHAQAIPGTNQWLTYDENTAWLVQHDGSYSIVSRWIEPVIKPMHLGFNTFALISENGITVRDLQYNQIYQLKIDQLKSAAFPDQAGIINLLQKDGDLLQWVKAVLY